jgi:TusA-related sulfurtransferase
VRGGGAGGGARLREETTVEKVLDARGLKCPMPIFKAKKELETLGPDDVLKVLATDKGSVLDMQGWAKANKHVSLIKQEMTSEEGGRTIYVHYLARLA